MAVYGKNAHKGKFQPLNPLKYEGDVREIFFRSSYEIKAFKWCDNNPSIVKWSSECVVVLYISPIDFKQHRYYVDLKITVKNSNESFSTYLIEIKPEKYVNQPIVPKRKTKSYIEECMQYAVNQAKWEAATQYALDRGWMFKVITEKHLGIKR